MTSTCNYVSITSFLPPFLLLLSLSSFFSPCLAGNTLLTNYMWAYITLVCCSPSSPESVPTPALENIGNTISIPDHQWKVALVWGTAGCGHDAEMCDCQFPSYLIDYTTVQVNCDGMETITQKVQIIL